jgi:hypothetical protein
MGTSDPKHCGSALRQATISGQIEARFDVELVLGRIGDGQVQHVMEIERIFRAVR